MYRYVSIFNGIIFDIYCTLKIPIYTMYYFSPKIFATTIFCLLHLHFQDDLKFYQCDRDSRVSLQNEQNPEKSRVTGYRRRWCRKQNNFSKIESNNLFLSFFLFFFFYELEELERLTIRKIRITIRKINKINRLTINNDV